MGLPNRHGGSSFRQGKRGTHRPQKRHRPTPPTFRTIATRTDGPSLARRQDGCPKERHFGFRQSSSNSGTRGPPVSDPGQPEAGPALSLPHPGPPEKAPIRGPGVRTTPPPPPRRQETRPNAALAPLRRLLGGGGIIMVDSGQAAFSVSNETSYSSGVCSATTGTETPSSHATPPETEALRRLSDSLESIFERPRPGAGSSFSDAAIVAGDGREVPVHRCVLAARSPFFGAAFAGSESGARLELEELVGGFGVGTEALLVVLGYLYSGKVKALPRGVCDCVDDECSHLACRPALEFLVQVLYASFRFQIPELVALYQRHLLDILDKVAPDDILHVLSAANICGDECHGLLAQCVEYVVRSDLDTITLEKGLPLSIIQQIIDSRLELGLNNPECVNFPDKHAKRIHRALDSDDVDLVRLLLKEGHTTLDYAYALHYAVAYCDPKTTTELLDLGIADVNRRNARGFTVLHVAAMRKEPNVIVSLLMKGAQPSDLTPDGRKALQLCKRHTKAADYMKSTEEGKPSPKDKLCVEILEQAEQREPLFGEASSSLAMAGDDLRMRLLYLENRVALARLLFPTEAKVAMAIAQVDSTCEVPLVSRNCKDLAGSPGTHVDLNEASFGVQEQRHKRMRALARTVELGKHFFPRCSNVLDKIMDADDDCTRLAYLDNGTREERLLKRRRFKELQEAFGKAFSEDKEEFEKSKNLSLITKTRSHGRAAAAIFGATAPPTEVELDVAPSLANSDELEQRVIERDGENTDGRGWKDESRRRELTIGYKNTAHGSKALTLSPLTEQRNDAPTFRQSVKHVERCAIQCPEDAAADGELLKPKNQFFPESITESTAPKSRGQKVPRPMLRPTASVLLPPPPSRVACGRAGPARGLAADGALRLWEGMANPSRLPIRTAIRQSGRGRDWEGNGASEGKKR
ncbi:hypothetical protein NL676_033540 [Syzygium grande]|nr:hypothetical protein NL676_033540 [Syzygium grande]